MTRRSSICISTSRRSDARQTTGHRHLRWLLILVVFQLSLFSASAQGFLKFQRDSIPFFRGFAVSADLVGLAQMQLGDYGPYEAALRLNLHDQYFPIVELGLGRANHQDDEVTHISYKTSAPYFRVGADVNIAKNKHAKNRIYAGQCSQHWAEILFGIEAELVGPLHLGWSVRYRNRLSNDDGGIGKTWYVPGYGTQDTSNLGFTFNVIVDI